MLREQKNNNIIITTNNIIIIIIIIIIVRKTKKTLMNVPTSPFSKDYRIGLIYTCAIIRRNEPWNGTRPITQLDPHLCHFYARVWL